MKERKVKITHKDLPKLRELLDKVQEIGNEIYQIIQDVEALEKKKRQLELKRQKFIDKIKPIVKDCESQYINEKYDYLVKVDRDKDEIYAVVSNKLEEVIEQLDKNPLFITPPTKGVL